MKTCLRILGLILVAGLGLAAAPTQGADATLGRDHAAVALAGSERWALRPSRMAATGPARPDKAIPLSDPPTERRSVRIVYQGYQGSAPPAASP